MDKVENNENRNALASDMEFILFGALVYAES